MYPQKSDRIAVADAQSFPNRREMYLHGMQHHYQTGGNALQERPWGIDQAPWETEGDPNLQSTYEANQGLILASSEESSVVSSYNVPLNNDFTIPQLMNHAQRIYDKQNNAFRLTFEFGLILRHTETGEYRYFRPHANDSLIQRPIYVSRRGDLNRLKLRLQRFDVTDYILRQRPNTRWTPYLVTNVRIVLYHLNYTLGHTGFELPEYIKQSKSIVALEKSKDGRPYRDHLCAFRCLAVHRGNLTDRLEIHTKTMFQRWVHINRETHREVTEDPKRYQGLPLDQLAYFEKFFEVNLNLFSLREDEVVMTVYKSRCDHKDTLNLNMYEHHLSYITNLATYAKKFECGNI